MYCYKSWRKLFLSAGLIFCITSCYAYEQGGATRITFNNAAIASVSPFKTQRSHRSSGSVSSARVDFSNFILADYILNSANENLAYDPSEQAAQLRDKLMPKTISITDEFVKEQLDEVLEPMNGDLIPEGLVTVKVKKGESLASIADAHGTTPERIRELNDLDRDSILKAGQNLKVQSRRIEYKVVAGDNLWELARKNGSSMELIARINNLKSLEINVGQELIIPVDVNKARQLPEKLASGKKLTNDLNHGGEYRWPANSHRVTSPFGYRRHPLSKTYHFHNGVDIAGVKGSPVYSVAEGIVTFSGWKDYSGNLIIVRHLDGVSTIYAHMNRLLVKSGTPVRTGQKIGEIGRTGRATGYHLHFGTRKYGAWSNPMQLFEPERIARKK